MGYMNKLVSSFLFAGAMFAVSAAPAMAWGHWWSHPGRGRGGQAHMVPEIDASAGLLAIAAVVAILAFVWERKRRAAA